MRLTRLHKFSSRPQRWLALTVGGVPVTIGERDVCVACAAHPRNCCVILRVRGGKAEVEINCFATAKAEVRPRWCGS